MVEHNAKGHFEYPSLFERMRRYRVDEHDCWIWDGHLANGRPQVVVGEADAKELGLSLRLGPWNVARLAWTLKHRKNLGDKFACHTCDNALCVNPLHIYPGTHEDNMQDMVARGRSAFGERQHNAKLTDEKVRDIHGLRAAGKTHQAIADQVGITKPMVGLILQGRNWQHIYREFHPDSLPSRSPAKPAGPRPDRTDLNPQELARLYVDEHWSLSQLTKQFNASQSAISDRLRRAGVRIRTVAEETVRQDIDAGEIIRLYNEGLAVGAIADRLGCSRSVINRRLEKAGIQKRSLQDAQQVRRHGLQVYLQESNSWPDFN